MSKIVLKGFVLLGILYFIVGCAPSYYSQGKRSLEQEDYDAAIQAFEKALKENPDDVRTIRELGIVYYRKLDFDKAIPTLLKAFIQDSTDGRTLFYLGTAYEIIHEYSHAIDIYRRYVDVSHLEDIRGSIEARLVLLIRKQMEEEAKAVLAQEEAMDVASIPDNTVAVLYFKNMGTQQDLDPLQKGIAEMLITDLSKVRSLKLIERLRVQKLLEEMGLGMTGFVDDATAPRVGRLLGASRLVNGTYIDLTDLGLRMDAGLLQIKEERPVWMEHVEGKFAQLFQLEKDLAFKIVDGMGIRLSQEERDEIELIPTENILAFMAYCRGLDYEDRGMFQEAAQEYQRAVELDPNFFRARQNSTRTEALSEGEVEVSVLEQRFTRASTGMEAVTSREPRISVAEETTQLERPGSPVTDHILHIGSVLNQGFLPGIDSRKPAQEQSQSSFGSTANIKISVPLPQRIGGQQ